MSEPHGVDLDLLDAEHPGEPFLVQIRGEVVEVSPPTDLPWRELVVELAAQAGFLRAGPLASLSKRRVDRLEQAYRAHFGLCESFDEDRRLVFLVQRFWRPIERDLARFYPGTDLGTEWRARRWRRLLNLIDGLPRNSHYIEAVADDEELAELQEKSPETHKQVFPRLAEYSPEVERLDGVYDRLGSVYEAVVASSGNKPPKLKPARRPRTAADRIRARRVRDEHHYIVHELWPAADAT